MYWCVFDLPTQEKRLEKLSKQSEDPDLWQDPENAHRVMKNISALRDEVESWHNLEGRIGDALELAQLEDESLRAELESETETLEAEISQREFLAMLSGKYDQGDALLAIHAGAGGTDSQDWAE
ncbi:MAG: PCRF domain-containing protein, partial [Anaerolineales bacterium]|nr:PCRF domain-containing protein [Anaerolineales bacterium]